MSAGDPGALAGDLVSPSDGNDSTGADDLARAALGLTAEEPTPAAGPVSAEPVQQTPEPTTEPATPPVHPVWESALKMLPEELRPALAAEIKKAEAESQKAIEKARESSLPPEWAEFANASQAVGASPQELRAAYNAMIGLQEDPLRFQAAINDTIEQMVASGQLTRKEGQEVKAELGSGNTDALEEFLTEEQKEIRDLKAWRAQQEAMSAQQQEQVARQQQEAQWEQEATAHAAAFVAAIDAAVGVPAGADESTLPDSVRSLRGTVAQVADGLLGRIASPTQQQINTAVAAAVQQLRTAGVTVGAPAPAPAAAAAPPLGNGTGHVVAPPRRGFATENDRDAAMVEAAKMMIANG